jgi:3-oxoacyl-[acyl-carrier protein] reductase
MFASLKDRSVIVTGGSRGIGRGLALRFGEVGCRVLVVARRAEQAQSVVDEIRSSGGHASSFVADVSKPDAMQDMVSAAVKRHGAVDILCANAGIFPAAKLESMSEQEFDTVVDINLKGMFLSVRACLPPMKARRYGRIILTSSITGPVTGFPGWAHYGATKAAQLGFMRTAAIELARDGITINAVLPGNIATEGLADMGPDYQAKMEQSIPMRRLGSVSDIANAVLYFASDEAAYVTGQSLIVDGGQVLPESLAALE